MKPRHYAGIFIVSAGTLLLELSLTRVLSVALWYHFGFLVISTAARLCVHANPNSYGLPSAVPSGLPQALHNVIEIGRGCVPFS